jgi:hypothetical protein
MNTKTINRFGHCNRGILQPSAEPEITQRVRLLVSAACVARAGAAQMTLSDWREVEQEVKRRLQYECQIHATLQEGVPTLHVPKNVPHKKKEDPRTTRPGEPDCEYTHH